MNIELKGTVNDEGRAVVQLIFGIEMTPAEVADFQAHLKNALIQASVAVGEKVKVLEAQTYACPLPLPPALPEVVDAASLQQAAGLTDAQVAELPGLDCGCGD